MEPLHASDLLRHPPNVLLAPHLGFVTEPMFWRFSTGVTKCLEARLTCEPLVRMVHGVV